MMDGIAGVPRRLRRKRPVSRRRRSARVFFFLPGSAQRARRLIKY